MLASRKFLDLELTTWQLNDADLTNVLALFNISLLNAPQNSLFFHNSEMQLQFRLLEIHAFKVKWWNIAAEHCYESNDFALHRMLRNKKQAIERKNLLHALVEASELIDALNKLKTLLNSTEDLPDSEIKSSVTEFYLEAEQLAYDLLTKHKLETPTPEIKSERAILTDVLNKTTAAYREPFDLHRIRDLAESGAALPAYKPGWKSFVVRHQTLVAVALGCFVGLAPVAVSFGISYACIAVGLSFAAQIIVTGLAALTSVVVSRELVHIAYRSAHHRSDQELLQDTELKTKNNTVVSALRKNSLYQMPQMPSAEVTPITSITRRVI